MSTHRELAKKLQKKTAGHKLWAEIKCTGPISEFAEELKSYLAINRSVRNLDDTAGRRAGRLCMQAERVIDEIDGVHDDHIGYGIKTPSSSWDRCQAEYLTLDESRQSVERDYAAGYTSEPFIQVVEIRGGGGKSVVAEWDQGAWIDPLPAAGFADRSK